MLVAFFADAHVGNHRRFGGAYEAGLNARCRLALDALGRAVAKSSELGRPTLVSLGDLFDTTRPEPQLISEAQGILDLSPMCQDTFLLLGNHEMESTALGDHALGPLGGYGGIQVVSLPRVVDLDGGPQLVMVPFRPGPATEWLPQVMEQLSVSLDEGRARVLCLHLGLSDDKTPPWLQGAPDSVPVTLAASLAKKHGCGAVVAGNWHARRRWEVDGAQLMQVGTLCPTGFDNPGLVDYGTLALFDSKTRRLSYVEIPGPRFLKLRGNSGAPAAYRDLEKAGNTLFVEMTVDQEHRCGSEEMLANLKEQGTIAGYELVADSLETETAARSAAQAARSSETFDEAIAHFVREMPLSDGVDRETVLARAKKYIEGA